MKFTMIRKLLLLSLLFLSPFISAEVKVSKPSHIMDQANLFSSGQEKKLLALLKDFNNKTKATLYILTVESLQKESIEGMSIRLIDQWNQKNLAPGDKDRDDGILFIIAKKERKTRLEISQGLEGKITDAKAGDFLRMLPPYFKKGKFYDGAAVVINECAFAINKSKLKLDVQGIKKSRSKDSAPPAVVIIFIIIFILISIFRRGGGGGIYISTGGGSFRSSGGGGFSGGGASGGW